MLEKKIDDDMKAALKGGDAVKVGALRMVKAAINNYAIEKRKHSLEDSEVSGLIQKQIKMREDSIQSFKKGGRHDLVAKETREKEILQTYLPMPLTPAEVDSLVHAVVTELGAKTMSDLGRVMAEALARAGARADGRTMSAAAGRLLGGG